jgi:hypothetical protein
VRQEWDDLKRASSVRAVGSLATAMGARIGVASGVLFPLLTWLVAVADRMGKEPLCLALSSPPGAGSVLPRSPYA